MNIGGYSIGEYWWLLIGILYIKVTVVSVCLFICGDKQGRGVKADTRPLDLMAALNNRMGGGRERPVKQRAKNRAESIYNRPFPPPPPTPGPVSLNAGPRHRQTGCIMHRVHTSYISDYWWYYINGYWWLLIGIILVTIGEYYINGYWWLLIGIILVTIGGYSIGGYWWLLIGIILMTIGGYLIY